MKTILTPRPAPRRTSRSLREEAIQAGVDPFIAGTTAPDDLAAIIRFAPQLRLVEDADLDTVPRLGIPFDPYEEAPDEAASTRYFKERRSNPDAMPDIASLDWIGANEYTPFDEYTGPGSAA